ncbi:hypothetical protein C8J57DRAFT_1517145 [Mycena rebaudengoi]|nr:hypothetical protein C8J57DRAFT_1540584 [Mycena rebaudengoi]KAJ7257101.1 hypothetical protein C8J57DRAFT_1517145 [Mycena rebaudengoi]
MAFVTVGSFALVTAVVPEHLMDREADRENKTPPRTTLFIAFPTTPGSLPAPFHRFRQCRRSTKGINLLQAESALAAVGLTPDIISNVSVSRLGEITGAVEGHLWGLQSFSREWSARL